MDKSYRDLFFGESGEYLREINSALVKLEKDPQDTEAINIVFRLTHTLKGMAATVGYKELADFAHQLEDAFDGFRSGKTKLTTEIMDTVFESMDAFAALIDDLKEDRPISVDVPFYLNKIANITSKEEKDKQSAVKDGQNGTAARLDKEYINRLKKEGKIIFRIEITLNKDSFMKGVRAFLVLERAKKIGMILRVFPGEEALKEEEFDVSFEFVLATAETKEALAKEFFKILEIEKVEISLFDVAAMEKLEKSEKSSPLYVKKIQSMRIPVDRLDKIMNLMGELAIARSRLLQIVHNKDYASLEEATYLLEVLIPPLQDELLKLRLIPISYILDNFHRVVRDLSRNVKKEIDLKIEGGEIELDRVILDDIGDPLVHIVRNAVDHGIELPSERIKSGKPVKGMINIRVSREKGHIIIEVSDDGRGMDFNKIAQKALEKGFVASEELFNLDASRVFDILALPGFSTKEEVTAVSGRGVGLDVVKDKIEALGGRVELESALGKGTKFILTLPLTLAIIKAMLVAVGKNIYAIPLMNIRETVKINTHDVKFIKDMEVIRLREEVIPIIRLDRELNIRSSREQASELSVVIVEGRSKSLGFVVDSVISEQDIVVKPLSSFIKKVKGITGATILGDGGVALILDVAGIR